MFLAQVASVSSLVLPDVRTSTTARLSQNIWISVFGRTVTDA